MNIQDPKRQETTQQPIAKSVSIDSKEDHVRLAVEHLDNTKYFAVLRSKHNTSQSGVVDDSVIDKINRIVETSKSKKTLVQIAQYYIEDNRKEIEFLHDIISLAKCSVEIAGLEHLFRIKEPTLPMHNRIIAQMLCEYSKLGYSVTSKPTNFLLPKNHDFNIGSFRCEVKTIQSIGTLERAPVGGVRFTSESATRLVNVINSDIKKAIEQVGWEGIIIISPWSYKINGVFRSYFSEQLSICPPPADKGLTILVLNSDNAFENLYLQFPTRLIGPIIESAISEIQSFGVTNITQNMIRNGLTFQLETANSEGSTVGYSFLGL